MANIEIDARRVEVFLDNLSDVFDTTGLMGDIGTYLVQAILNRTAKGIDYEGQEFMPYTPSYARFRELSGRQTHPVNLYFSGHMLSAMTYEADPSRVKIFFMDTVGPDNMSAPAKAYYNDELREFFSISEEERNKILDIVSDYIDDHIY